ncbi:DUF3772 domain-containing protein, partial [Pectobacterium brasiliense]
MNILSSAFLRVCLLAMLMLPVGYASAASADSDPDPQPAQTDAPVKINVDAELVKLQKQLDNIKQQVSGTNSDSKFGALNDTTQELVNSANELANAVAPQRAQIQAQLDVLGPAPEPGSSISETSEVTRKRNSLNTQKAKMDAQIEQIQALRTGASNLSAQIVTLRRNALKTQLALNSGSILGGRFWAPIVAPQA